MEIVISQTTQELGEKAAAFVAQRLNASIANKGRACLLLSTGISQLEVLDALVQQKVNWEAVTMFHLDEYIGLPETHTASFRRYLKERFACKVPLKEAIYVNGEADAQETIAMLTSRLSQEPVDVALVGIGENGHIAFNDPPADFNTKQSYIVVHLDDRCKQQQVSEGWFAAPEEVPTEAISMTVSQILRSQCIVSVVPHAAKAEAVKNTLQHPLSPLVPATALKLHPDWHLFLDAESSAGFLQRVNEV